ncbi:hypothetical protein WME89_13515 [Sorangium sp. So ce321]|uniref:hypothetical protein n=1 Tax=Sorangium sp. So ce321 TaxID=3133300 RepID=UPI003F6270FF
MMRPLGVTARQLSNPRRGPSTTIQKETQRCSRAPASTPPLRLHAAPGQAKIQIFASAARARVEIENQGACAEIPAGGSPEWTVRWYLCALAAAAVAEPGDAGIAALVAQPVKWAGGRHNPPGARAAR